MISEFYLYSKVIQF